MERYIGRVSGPLLDRIDLHIEVPSLEADRLTDQRRGEPSAVIAARVREARARQVRRFTAETGVQTNADMGARLVREHCALDAAGERLLRAAVQRLGLSARAYHRVLRVARTIADLAAADAIAVAHVAEAVQYRSLDRRRTRAR